MRSSSVPRSRSLSLVVFGAASALFFTGAGCRIEAHTQTQFEDSSQPAKTASKDWAGEKITIQNDGINPAEGTTGVEVKVDPTAKRISATATFAAHADDDKKTDADAAIQDAIASMVIDESSGFTIRCGHGSSHGSASSAGSGCKILTVTIPAGTDAMPLDLTIGNGNGLMRVGLANAGDVPVVKNLIVDNKGSGDVDVRARPIAGASLVITGGDSVQLALPANFSTAKVTFAVDETDPAIAATRIKFTAFAGMENGKSYPTAAPLAGAATLVSLESKGILDLDTVTLTSF